MMSSPVAPSGIGFRARERHAASAACKFGTITEFVLSVLSEQSRTPARRHSSLFRPRTMLHKVLALIVVALACASSFMATSRPAMAMQCPAPSVAAAPLFMKAPSCLEPEPEAQAQA